MAMRDRLVRWSLAAVLIAAALVDGYLAASEGVLWPVALAMLWIGLAAALLTEEAREPAVPSARSAPTRVPAPS